MSNGEFTNPFGRSFLSYRRTRADEARLLIEAQRERGIPTWQDISNLEHGHTGSELRMTLADPDTANAWCQLSLQRAGADPAAVAASAAGAGGGGRRSGRQRRARVRLEHRLDVGGPLQHRSRVIRRLEAPARGRLRGAVSRNGRRRRASAAGRSTPDRPLVGERRAIRRDLQRDARGEPPLRLPGRLGGLTEGPRAPAVLDLAKRWKRS